MLDKAQLIAALREAVRADLERQRQSQRKTQEGAVHPENRAEHAKDTRATEASYLARGLAERVAALERDLALLDSMALGATEEDEAIRLGSLVVIETEEGESTRYFVAAAAGGVRFDVDGESYRVLTPASPLGRVVLGREAGDDIDIDRPRGRLRATIVSVS